MAAIGRCWRSATMDGGAESAAFRPLERRLIFDQG